MAPFPGLGILDYIRIERNKKLKQNVKNLQLIFITSYDITTTVYDVTGGYAIVNLRGLCHSGQRNANISQLKRAGAHCCM